MFIFKKKLEMSRVNFSMIHFQKLESGLGKCSARFFSQIILSFAVNMHSPPTLVILGSQSCKLFNVMVVKSLKNEILCKRLTVLTSLFFVGRSWSHQLPFRKRTYDISLYTFDLFILIFCKLIVMCKHYWFRLKYQPRK